MPRGAPDDSNVRKETAVYSLSDLAELAVRLDSPVVYSRSGDVLFIDTFEAGYAAWLVSALGTGAGAYLAQDTVLSGGVSLQLNSGTGTLPYLYLKHTMAPPVLSRVGFATALALASHVTKLDWIVWYYDGEAYQEYWLRYDATAYTLSYLNSDGGATILESSFTLEQYLYLFYQAKLVVDLETRKYVKFQVNDLEFSMKGLAGWFYPDTMSPRMIVALALYGETAASGLAYLDNVIVTQNEP